jgi:RNA-binding protein YhbY
VRKLNQKHRKHIKDVMAKTREEKRNESAEKVCRELRYQLVKYGTIGDTDSMMKHFNTWMNNAKKNKYKRP